MSLPPSVFDRLPRIQTANASLIHAFAAHSAFAAQHAQRTGKIYFMWDFAQRTNAMYEAILNNNPPPDTPATRGSIPNVPPACMTEAKRKELRQDAVGRSMMLHEMINDTTGKTSLMFGEKRGQEVDVGDAVRAATKSLVDVILGVEASAA